MCDLPGNQHELHFWTQYIPARWYKFSEHFKLNKYFAEMIGEKKFVRILDIGCGGTPLTGTMWPGVKVEYHPADLMADEYMTVWESIGKKPVVKIEKQDMAALTYSDGFFDIVYCATAIDHCADPRAALMEMRRVCAPGGWVFLRHFPHEGKKLRYSGMHQWNVDITEQNDTMIWNKTEMFLLSKYFPGAQTFLENPTKRHVRVCSKYKKADL